MSVQIAKTTLLLALGKEVINSKNPVYLNIILANTLLAPEGVQNLFGGEFQMNIDKEKYLLNTQVLDDVKLFDEALEICNDLAEQTMGSKKETEEVFGNILQRHFKGKGLNTQVIESFYKVYVGLKNVKEKGRNSIWKFIVQNLYKPYFFKEKFDYVIGNPPWFTFNSIKNESYQNILVTLANLYDVKPVKAANMPQMEIAAIFLAHCTNYFLKENGKLSFVLPRSFFSADHHDNTRSGKTIGMRLINIWDLDKVSPLFRIPSGVLFTERNEKKRNILGTGLKGVSFSGEMPSHNCNFSEAQSNINEEIVTWYYAKQGNSSALSRRKYKSQNKINPYHNLFKNGATIFPRQFYFVDLTQIYPDDFEDRIVNIKSSESIKNDAKKPWKGIEFNGKMESKFFFKTALARCVLPFSLYNPNLIVLPIIIERNGEGKSEITLKSANELMHEGYLNASRWFRNVENVWEINKTEKSKSLTSNGRINFQNGLTSQNLNKEFLVLYNSSAKNANATVIERNKLDLEFLVENVTYVFYTTNSKEAYYLASILNSAFPNELIKDFQARGLFGARHVHKKILDIYFPKFDEANEIHLKLAEYSKTAHEKAAQYLIDNPPKKELTATRLGKLRVDIKKHLHEEMKEIDKLVKKVVGEE